MEMRNNTPICRLCCIKLEVNNSVHIFRNDIDLAQKINDTLSLKVSPDDDSVLICLECYNKVINHYNFMQNIMKQSKRNVNTTENNSCELNKIDKIEIVSKEHSNVMYACPNCNIDLMIIITNDPEDCSYAFQIALATVDQIEKLKEEDSQMSKDTIDIDNSCTQKLNEMDEEIEAPCIVINENTYEASESTAILQEDDNCMDEYITFPNRSVFHRTNKHSRKRLQEDVILKADNSSKVQKLSAEIDTTMDKREDTNSVNSDYDNADDVLKVESVSDNANNLIDIEAVNADTDNLVKIVSINGNSVELFHEEADGKEDDSIAYTTETERERVDEDSTKYDDFDIKSYPKIACNLCGTRFISQMKYKFHMERHERNKMDKFVCTICDKEASSENLLWDHYFHTHKSSSRYTCAECNKMFAKKTRLKTHQKKYKHFGINEWSFNESMDKINSDQKTAKDVPVNCSLCRKPITDLDNDPKAINDLITCAACEDSTLSLMVDGIEMKAISPRQYHCSMCPKHFVRKERLEFHEMRHNENMNEFVCSTCGKEFSAENSLYEHYLFVHKGARPHICELCGKSFQLKTRLKEHLRTHTGERPYQCDICGQRRMTTNALKLHRKTHFSSNRYTCNICDKSFSKKQNMNEHLEKHWKNDKNVSLPQLFTCPVCMEDLPTYRMLKYHMIETHQIHHQDPLLTGQKPWHECNECHEKFKHQMSLKAHKEKVHEGRVNPIFQCDVCKVTYKIKQMLINHIRSKHEGEKRYKCAQCGKGFNDTKSLYNHILLHTGRKPFQCEYCSISFRRKDSRDHHRRKHTGEQPYQCMDCGQSFSTYSNRNKHRKKEHGEGEVDCPECGEKCSQQEIRIHLNKHLGEKLNKMQDV